MTDVQVSNARRIVFTALALVTLWTVSFGAYSLSCQMPENLHTWFGPRTANRLILYTCIGPRNATAEDLFTGNLMTWADYFWFYRVLACGLLMALIPLAFLSLSRHNSLITLRDHRILIGGLLFATCIECCYWVGERDAWDVIERAKGNSIIRWRDFRVSWLLLLLPIILTTAFVIVGAWRRAVRDVAVEAVGEGE